MEFFIAALLGAFLSWYILTRKFKKLTNKFQSDINHLSSELEEKIDTGAAKLEAVLQNMLEGVMVTDKKGEIILMNPSMRRLFLVDSFPKGKMFLEVIRNIEVQNMINILIKGEQRLITGDIFVHHPAEKVLKVNGVSIIKEGDIECAVLVFHDITELRQLEKIRQDFVANVSHELRTPITSIKGYAETLLAGAIDDKDNATDFLKIIYSDSNRLAKLIDDLLDLSRIESGKMMMVFLPVGILSIVKRTISIIDNQAKLKSMLINVDVAPNLPKVLADEARLSQVILNLLDNAVKYTPEGGTITISASVKDGFIQVDVSDTGIGIHEKDLPRIFERFYRVDKAHSRELGGTGLGLSIVKHIIHAHGGEVGVKSEPRKGSTFSFTIPKA